MRQAPAVTVGCSGGPFWQGLLCLLPALAATAVVYWAGSRADLMTGGVLPLALLAGALAALVAWRTLPPRKRFGWDGAQWTCDGQPVRPQVLIDTGVWLLIRLRPLGATEVAASAAAHESSKPAWLAVSVGDAGSAWHALRAALYCRPPEPQPSGNARQPP